MLVSKAGEPKEAPAKSPSDPRCNSGGTTSYTSFQEVPGKPLGQWLSSHECTDMKKLEFSKNLLQGCLVMHKEGKAFQSVIRPEVILYDEDKKQVSFLNDKILMDEGSGARAKGTYAKDAYCFPEDSSHRASQEQKDVFSCAILFMNLFSGRPEGCSAAKVRSKDGHAYVERKAHLMMEGTKKIATDVRLSCLQLFEDMSSSKASARPALSVCLKRLSEQADLYSAIVQSIESKESYERQCRENMHSLQLQIDKVSKSTDLDKSAKDSQLALLEQQLVEAKVQLSKYEQVNKEKEEALKQKHQALEMQKSESRKLKEENDGLLQEHEELESQLREAAEKVKDLGGQSRKIQQDAREKQDELKADKKLCEERALQLQEELSGKQKSYDGKVLELEEEIKARQVSEQRYQELKKQVLEEMKSCASNEPGKKADFMNNISGAMLAWPLPERIQLLDDLCCSIILNKDGSYQHRGNSRSYRPVNFTQTQIDQINMLRAEALKAAIAMLNKAMLDDDDSLKFKTCKYLDESLAVHFQPTHSLQSWDSGCQVDSQKLLAKTPEIWKFRDHGEKGKCHPLQMHFQDGRVGDKNQDKKLTDYMKHLANAGVEVAGKALYEEISDRSIVDKT